MIDFFDHRSASARPIPGGHASRARHRWLATLLAVLCACNGNTLNLGESDQAQPGVDSGADAGDGGRGGGSGGPSSGGSGNLGAGGSSDGGGTSGNGGTLDGGGTLGGGGSSGSAGDPQPWWHYTNEHSCQSEGVPSALDRPVSEEAGPTLAPIYLAMSRIRFGTVNDDLELTPNPNAWRDIGFDLDKRCTTSFTCEDPPELIHEVACRHPSSQIPYDANQCRDNEFGKLFRLASSSPSIGDWFGMTEADWNCELHRGGFGMMFKISEYNGQRNDRQVRLDVYSTLGLKTLPPWTCRAQIQDPLSSTWPQRAPWRAQESWKIADTSISLSAPDAGNELRDATVYDPAAFVRNGYLFARLPDNSHFWLNGENTPIPGFSTFLYRGILTGALVKQPDGTWTIADGTLGGVVRPDQLLESFQNLGFCNNLCNSHMQVWDYLNTYRDALTSTADILPETPCDGLTFGAKFAARQAAATSQNVTPAAAPVRCPQPRHPNAPRQGCVCPAGGGRCELPDGGS